MRGFAIGVLLVAVRFGIADQIEPVPRPMFAMLWAGEQPIDQTLVGIRPVVFKKVIHFIGRWRQAEKIEGQPANERPTIGLWRSSQSVFLQLGGDEGIDRIPWRAGGISLPVIWSM